MQTDHNTQVLHTHVRLILKKCVIKSKKHFKRPYENGSQRQDSKTFMGPETVRLVVNARVLLYQEVCVGNGGCMARQQYDSESVTSASIWGN